MENECEICGSPVTSADDYCDGCYAFMDEIDHCEDDYSHIEHESSMYEE